MPEQRKCRACAKRVYRSSRHAMLAHRQAGYRLRFYVCPAGEGWHAANADKTAGIPSRTRRELRGRGVRPRRPMYLAPTRTLAEVEAIAAARRQKGA